MGKNREPDSIAEQDYKSNDMGAVPGLCDPPQLPASKNTSKEIDHLDIADFITSMPSFEKFLSLVTAAPTNPGVIEATSVVHAVRALAKELYPLDLPPEDLEASLAFAFLPFHDAVAVHYGEKIQVLFEGLRLVAHGSLAKATTVLSTELFRAPRTPSTAIPAVPTNRLHKDNTLTIADDTAKLIGVQPAENPRELAATLWQLRQGFARVEICPKVLVALVQKLLVKVMPNVTELPPAHTLSSEPISKQEAGAQLDALVKKHIAPQVAVSDLAYMVFLVPFFARLPEEGAVSVFTRLQNLMQMSAWAQSVFDINLEQALVLHVINTFDNDPHQHHLLLKGFLHHDQKTVDAMLHYCVTKAKHVGNSGKSHDPMVIGHAISAYPTLTTPFAVNAAKHKFDFKNTDDLNAKRNRTENEANADPAAASRYHDQSAMRLRQEKCQRCGKVNHEAIDCLQPYVPRPGRCNRCASTKHNTAACPGTDLLCGRCRSTTHRTACCPETIQLARILLGERAPADATVRILRSDPNNASRFVVNAVTVNASTEPVDDFLDSLCSTHGVDPQDVNILPTPAQELFKVAAIGLNALSSDPFLPPEIRTRIDGPLTSELKYASVEFQQQLGVSQPMRKHQATGLCDSGATICVVSAGCVDALLSKQVVTGKDIYKIPNFSITVADNTSVQCPGLLLATISSSGETFRGGFFILKNVPYDLIIGRPGLSKLYGFKGFASLVKAEPQRVLSLEHSVQREDEEHMEIASRMPTQLCTLEAHEEGRAPWIPEISEGGARMLQVNFPLMHRADVEPHVEPPRRTSKNEDRIVHVLVDNMIAAGKLEAIPSSSALIILPIVLVDKLAHENPRPPPITDITDKEAILSRYRFCIDSRITNQLELRERNGTLIYVAPKRADIKNSPAHAPYQYQTGAYELLSRMPAKAQYFARVDIKNAFYGVRLHPDLSRLFCFEVHNWDTGKTRTYKMRVLPQGWRWSPLFFRKVSQFIVDKLEAKLRELFPELGDGDIYICFLQDDIVLAGSSYELTVTAQNLLMDILTSYSFQVNRAKSLPPSETLEFCGYLLCRGMVTPTATRKSVTLEFAESAWTTYLKLTPQARLKWFHSIAGTFHFSRPFLDATCALNLRIIYDHIKLLNNDPLAVFDSSVVKNALSELVEFLNLGLPPSILFHFPKVYSTILVTDANIKAWAAQLFYLVDGPTTNANLNEVLPDLTDLTKRLTSAEGFPSLDVPDTAILVPVRMAADIFNHKDQVTSSTARERYAQLEAVDELFPLFQGPVVLINDNQNSRKNWHEVDRLFVGRRADQFSRYQQHVHAVAWLPRECNLATLVDELARLRETLVTTAAKNNIIITNTDANAVVATMTAPAPTTDGWMPTHSSREIISLPPPVPVVESHPMDAVVLSTLTELFPAHYLADRTQEHRGVNMADICRHLFYPEVHVDAAVASAARTFTVMHGMVFRQYREALRLYVPNFSYAGALSGSEMLSSHTYLVLLAHFGHGAHASPTRMEADLKRTFWWPDLKRDINQFANACVTCRHIRATHDAHRGSLGTPTAEADRPFRVWQMDFAEAPDRRGYILIFICAFSGYVISRKCNSSQHHHVLDTLWDQIIYVHGVPHRVHCDQGTHFTADAVKSFAHRYGIRLTFGPAAHPRAQGMVEKAIGDVKKAYETVVATHDGIAPARALLIAVWQHNTHMHSRLGFTPYEIVHGFRNRSLLDLVLPLEVERHLTAREQELRDIIHTLVLLRREDARAVYQENYLAGSHPSNIKIGDLVYKYVQAPVPGGHRLECKGMYFVVRPASATTWILSADQWTPGRQWMPHDREAQFAVPELQLRRVGDVGDYAGRIFTPPPAPAPLTRQDRLGNSVANDALISEPDSSLPRYNLRSTARGAGDPGNSSTGGMS